jgi:hypothetical protein
MSMSKSNNSAWKSSFARQYENKFSKRSYINEVPNPRALQEQDQEAR